MGPSYHVEWSNGELIYTAMESGYQEEEKVIIAPTPAQWQKFWKVADKINIWSWEADYPNPGIMDGTNWSIKIKWCEKYIESMGDNNYPGGNSDEPGPSFNKFLRAVQGLMGGLEFR